MTAASEWHRAGLAVSGVTLVLLIAAGIHFITPPRPDRTVSSPAIATTTLPPVAAAAPAKASAVLAELATAPRFTLEPKLRFAATGRARQVLPDSIATDSRGSASNVHDAALGTPLVASGEIPELSLRLEPIRMPVSAEFGEPLLPSEIVDHNGTDREVIARDGRQRDPVTAAFVTAGNAVAGGFRSAGRALKRAF